MIRRAGAFTKLIEIPAARAVAKGVMVPARNFMDGANGGELVLDDELWHRTVRWKLEEVKPRAAKAVADESQVLEALAF